MLRAILSIAWGLATMVALAQSWHSVCAGSDYVWGEGWGATVSEADRAALQDLVSKISVHVSATATTEHVVREDNAAADYSSTFHNAVNTYAQATLNNTEKVILSNEPDAHVGRWIRKAEIDRIFESRKAKVLDYVESARKAESRGKIDVALKDYYWALALLRSLRYPGELHYTAEDGNDDLLLSWLPQRINDILGRIKTVAVQRRGDDVEVRFSYDGKTLPSIDYAYFDGHDWSRIYSAKDGVGIIELAPGHQSSTLQLRYEYAYADEAHIDREVESVLASIGGVPMRSAYCTIKAPDTGNTCKGSADASEDNEKAVFSSTPAEDFAMPHQLTGSTEDYRDAVMAVTEAVLHGRYDDVTQYFTPEGLEIYNRLLRYGRAKLVGEPHLRFYRHGRGVAVRGVQMAFSFSGGVRHSFVEDLVFYFDAEGKIEAVVFGLGKTAEADILGKGLWSEQARLAVMSFLENYQTAYALGRLEYLESIFDDNAVIITGTVNRVPKRVDSPSMAINNDIITYNRQTKNQFLQKLARSFASKEYINLRLADNDVLKLAKGGELYAIQISQEYYSSNYSDKGYLFLIVDINDPVHPIIKVRTWQPEKDPDFGLYGPGDF